MNKALDVPPIQFIDLAAQRDRLGARVREAVLRVVEHGAYIMGPEVKRLEKDLATFCGASEVISCANGTDALALVLMAKQVGSGDAVLCPSFTFAATAEVIALSGATPYFVEVHPDTFNINPASLAAGIRQALNEGLRPVGVIAVDLFGQPADYDAILPIAEENGLWTMCDSAQAFGATYKDRRIGTIGQVTTTSFFPAKPLGCYGDGGAIFTEDAELGAILRSLRVHGQGSDKYDNVRIGTNGRLDTIQAAVLIEKLAIFSDEIAARNRVAQRYIAGLGDSLVVPTLLEGCTSVWAQFTVRVPAGRRDPLAARLKERGIPTAIYYPRPLHQQTAYRRFPVAGGQLPISDRLAQEVLSLPMHPYLEPDLQDYIIGEIRTAMASA